MDIKIALAIPTNRQIQPETWKSFMELYCPFDRKVILANGGYTTAENRNYIAWQAQVNKCTHIFSVDDDMVFDRLTLTNMLKHDKEIIGVVAMAKSVGQVHTITLLNQEELSDKDKIFNRLPIPEELFKVRAVGNGIILIKTEVFDKLERPWYANETDITGANKKGEDYWFCEQATKAGFDIWCDPQIKVGHIGSFCFEWNKF